ncbi:hypothetical protein ZWY2020_023734 [Hordeum vulgare]|nr:hypothetical protein ZWY2020_023734 [Hordeum vulgare]
MEPLKNHFQTFKNQKSKADNRCVPRLNSALQEKLGKKKGEYTKKMWNRVAMIHKEAEEQQAIVEARRHEEMTKCQEMAAKNRSRGVCAPADDAEDSGDDQEKPQETSYFIRGLTSRPTCDRKISQWLAIPYWAR